MGARLGRPSALANRTGEARRTSFGSPEPSLPRAQARPYTAEMGIGTEARWTLGVFAVALLASAAAATVAGRELVAVALIAGGILFVLAALTGRLPFKFTMGGVGAEYRETVREDLARAVTDYTVTYRGDIVKRRPEVEPSAEEKAAR